MIMTVYNSDWDWSVLNQLSHFVIDNTHRYFKGTSMT